MSVRLTDTEFSPWSTAAVRSPFGTLARWCREAVAQGIESYPLVGLRSWALARMPDISAFEGTALLHACSLLNHQTMRSHRLGAVVGEVSACLLLVQDAAANVPRIEAPGAELPSRTREVSREELRPHLVNVRVSTDELEVWTGQAHADGYARVSGWVRAMVGAQLGLIVPPEPLAVPEPVVWTRRQLAGAMTNLAQVYALADEAGDARLLSMVEETRAGVQKALAGLYGPGQA